MVNDKCKIKANSVAIYEGSLTWYLSAWAGQVRVRFAHSLLRAWICVQSFHGRLYSINEPKRTFNYISSCLTGPRSSWFYFNLFDTFTKSIVFVRQNQPKASHSMGKMVSTWLQCAPYSLRRRHIFCIVLNLWSIMWSHSTHHFYCWFVSHILLQICMKCQMQWNSLMSRKNCSIKVNVWNWFRTLSWSHKKISLKCLHFVEKDCVKMQI